MEDALATLVSGSVSGAVADAITHPISTVKTRLQVQGAASVVAGGAQQLISYRGPFHATTNIIRSEGVGALYTGLGAVLSAAAPAQAERSVPGYGHRRQRVLRPMWRRRSACSRG